MSNGILSFLLLKYGKQASPINADWYTSPMTVCDAINAIIKKTIEWKKVQMDARGGTDGQEV